MTHASTYASVSRRVGIRAGMAEYEVSREMPAPREIAFQVAQQVERMESWLPTTVEVSPSGPNQIHVEGDTPHGHYATDGLFRAEMDQLRLEWGSKGTDDYSGWMQFADSGAGASEATLHLSFRGGQPQAHGGEAARQTEREMTEALDRLAVEVQARISEGG